MKCEELKPIKQGSVELGEYWVYDAEEVDADIAELKAENERLVKCCKEYDSRQRIGWCNRWLEIAELKQKNDDSRYNIAVLRKEKSHDKYKRCLAMAALWFERIETSTDLENERVSLRRYNKWKELGEKFKVAK